MKNFRVDLRAFGAGLALLLAVLFSVAKPIYHGDLDEYVLMTVAMASHGTPDIRLEDIEVAKRLLPRYSEPFDRTASGIRAQAEIPKPGFWRSKDGGYYAIHFFAYSALAAVPFKFFQAAGIDPMASFTTVNAFAIWVLGIALFRFFGSAGRAVAALSLFALCGLAPYALWYSPECMTAAFLLAGLVLLADGAPILGALLAGLGAMQNPSLLFFAGAAPLLLLATGRAGWRALFRPRMVVAAALATAMALLPFVFNQLMFGMPSFIARYATDQRLIGPDRLLSFFFDLNQGMVVGVPALLAALLVTRAGWRGSNLRVLLWAVLFTVLLALPSLSATNWNSAATGMMRYCAWAAMPLLFAYLWRLQALPRWSAPALAALFLAQAAATGLALRYDYLELSPVARAVMERFPRHYNPDPEILYERLAKNDNWGDPQRVFFHTGAGAPRMFFHSSNPALDDLACGPGGSLSATNAIVELAGGWRYLHGKPRCNRVGGLLIDARSMDQGGRARFDHGWGDVELGGGEWDGRWSVAPQSRMTLSVPDGFSPRQLALAGMYFEGKGETGISINGRDFGRHRLDRGAHFDVSSLPDAPRTLEIVLHHHGYRQPAPGAPDQRAPGLFLQKIQLR